MLKKLVSVVLCVVICALMFTPIANAQEISIPEIDIFGEMTMDKIPTYIRKHIKQNLENAVKLDLDHVEQMNSINLINADGTKTVLAFDDPVKFTDEDGKYNFINSNLQESTKFSGVFEQYAFENTNNSFKTYYPKKLKKGVSIELGEYSLKIAPETQSNSKAEQVDNKTVKYDDIYGEGTYAEYVSTPTGFKENIIIEEKIENLNTLTFVIKTKGLHPQRNTGKYINMCDDEGNIVYRIGETFIYDSNDVAPHSTYENFYSIEQQNKNKYILTVNLDESYLNSPDTVYPITIDPEIVISNKEVLSDNTPGSGAFTDVTVDSYGGTAGDYPQNYIGKDSATGFEYITYVRFNDIGSFVYINPLLVKSAIYTVKEDPSAPSNTTYNVSIYKGDDDDYDCEDVTWEQAVKATTPTESNDNVVATASFGQSADFNISTLFIDWLTVKTKSYADIDTLGAEDGFYIKATDSNSGRKFLSSSNPGHSNRPHLTVTYYEDTGLESGYYFIQSGYYWETNARYLTYDGSDGAILYDEDRSSNYQLWHVVSIGNGNYRISNVGAHKHMVSYNEFHVNLEELSQMDADNGYCQFKILNLSNGYMRIMAPGSGYLKPVSAKNYGKTNGTEIVLETTQGIDNQRWKFHKVDLGIVSSGSQDIKMHIGESVTRGLTTVPTGLPITYSTSNSSVVTVNENTWTAVSEGTAVVTATVYTKDSTGATVPFSKQWTITVYASDEAPEGLYYLKNVNSQLPMKVKTNGYVEQNEYAVDESLLFELDKDTSTGYYFIKSFKTGQYISLGSDSNYVQMSDSTSDLSKWRVIASNGTYKFVNRYNETSYLNIYSAYKTKGSGVVVGAENASSSWMLVTGCTTGWYGDTVEYYKKHTYGHQIEEVVHPDDSFSYVCTCCNTSFVSPDAQDFGILSDRDFVTVQSLKRAAMLALGASNIKGVEACLRAVDKIRATYNPSPETMENAVDGFYYTSDFDGKYISPYTYTYSSLNDVSIMIYNSEIDDQSEWVSEAVISFAEGSIESIPGGAVLVAMIEAFRYQLDYLQVPPPQREEYASKKLSDFLTSTLHDSLVNAFFVGLADEDPDILDVLTSSYDYFLNGKSAYENLSKTYYDYAFDTTIDIKVDDEFFTYGNRFRYDDKACIIIENEYEYQRDVFFASDGLLYNYDNDFYSPFPSYIPLI